MICEYALEPELVATWHTSLYFSHFIKHFGFDPDDGRATGRVVTQYPSKWKKRVWDAFNSGQPAQYFTARRRIEILLEQLGKIPVRRSDSVWDDQRTWLENAEEENKRYLFHAILARDNPDNNPQVMRGEDVLPGMDLPSLWRVPREIPVIRTATSMATHLEPMLRCATRILFIDPYFRASEPRWRNPLKEFLKIICDSSREVTLEYHTSGSYDKAPSRDLFFRECKQYLPRIIPRGFTITVRRWKNRNNGEELHNRYILTDIGGVGIPNGLDERDQGTVDIYRLSLETWQQRLKDYGYASVPKFDFDPEKSAFDLKGKVCIVGTKV